MTELFTKMLEKELKKTIRNKDIAALKIDEVFRFDYIPEKLPEREKECKEIVNHIIQGRNLVITGLVSTGKTVSVKRVFEVLKTNKPEWDFVFINCKDVSRSGMYHEIIQQLGGESKPKGWSISNYIIKMEKVIKGHERIILCLDDVDCLLKRHDPQDLFFPFAENTKFTTIFIANSNDWYDKLDVRVISRLQSHYLQFFSYDVNDIHAILNERVKIGLQNRFIKTTEIGHIAVIVNNQIDKLRMGLKLLNYLIDWKIDNEKIDTVLSKEEISDLHIAIKDKDKRTIFEHLPNDYKVLIYVLATLISEKELTTMNNIFTYWNNNTSKKSEITAKSADSLRLYLKILETHGLVKEEKKLDYTGRGRRPLVYTPLYNTEKYLSDIKKQ